MVSKAGLALREIILIVDKIQKNLQTSILFGHLTYGH